MYKNILIFFLLVGGVTSVSAQSGKIRTDSVFTFTSTINDTDSVRIHIPSNFIFNIQDTLRLDSPLELKELTAPPTPTSGFGRLYVKSSDSDLYFLNDSGTETSFTSS